jgi:hypothetical protein
MEKSKKVDKINHAEKIKTKRRREGEGKDNEIMKSMKVESRKRELNNNINKKRKETGKKRITRNIREMKVGRKYEEKLRSWEWEYFVLRDDDNKKEEKYMFRSFMICIHLIQLERLNESNETVGT